MVAVSIIMACYNAADYVERAVASLQAQTMQDWELLAVDDASSDKTVTVLQALVADDQRIKLKVSAVNGGPSAARNIALSAATGDWVTVLDADDAYRPERLETLMLHADGYDMIFDNLSFWDEGSKIMTGTALLIEDRRPRPFTIKDLINSENPTSKSKYGFLKPAIRRRFIEENRIKYEVGLRLAEDFDLYARCLLSGAQAQIIVDPLYIYTTQVGADSGLRAGGTRTVYDPHVRLPLAAGLLNDFGDKVTADVFQLLKEYAAWQKLYADVFDLSVYRKKWDLISFGRVSMENPSALWRFIKTSRLFKRIRAIA